MPDPPRYSHLNSLEDTQMRDWAAGLSGPLKEPVPGPLECEKMNLLCRDKELLIKDKFQQIRTLELEIARLKAITAPIRRLPPELLSQVFALIGDPRYGRSSSIKSVMQCCKAWRQICLRTPSAWANVDCTGHKNTSMIMILTPPLNVLRRVLTLSGSTPLSVTFRDLRGMQGEEESTFFDALTLHARRFQDLSMSSTYRLLSRLYHNERSLSALTRLRLYDWQSLEVANPTSIQLPALDFLYIHGICATQNLTS